MKKKELKTKSAAKPVNFAYPASQDIYSKSKEEQNINPEDTSKLKVSDADDDEVAPDETDFNKSIPGKKTKSKTGKKNNEKGFTDDVSGGDLDFQRSEFDDDGKRPGDEDEENDYYSLGGDDHNDLDEDRG